MNRLIAHPRVLAAMLDDFAWLVSDEYLDGCTEGWRSFVEGWLATEELFERRTWRRRERRHAA